MGDEFVARKFRWLDQVSADENLTPLCFHVAYRVVAHLSRQKGDAWPSQERMASECHVTRTGLRNAITRLVEQGHLAVETGGGRCVKSHYKPVLKTGEADPETGNERCQNDPPQNRQPTLPFVEAKLATKATETGNKTAPKLATGVATIPLIEPIEETIEEERVFDSLNLDGKKGPEKAPEKPPPKASAKPPKARATEEQFETFWWQYPRRVGKDDARRAYHRVVASGKATPDELLNAAMRFSAERDRVADPAERERFTPHPATWLNAGRWSDAPSAAPSSGQFNGHGASTHRPAAAGGSWLDIAMAGMKRPDSDDSDDDEVSP